MTPEATLKRKKRLGRAASYSILGEMAGVSHTTVRAVLTNGPRAIEPDREGILRKVNAALDEIEANMRAAA